MFLFPSHYQAQNCQGNVLFLILIAVALFAALSYAVSSSNRGGSSNISAEKAESGAAAMVQHLATIRQAIDRMKLVNNCTPEQFNFTSYYSTQNNVNSPSDKRCHLYDSAGGRISPVTFPKEYFDPAKYDAATTWVGGVGPSLNYRVSFNSSTRWRYVGTDANGAASADLVGQFYGVSDVICRAVNKRGNVNSPSFNPPSTNPFITATFGGVYNNGSAFTFSYPYGCYYNTSYNANFIVYPLIDR